MTIERRGSKPANVTVYAVQFDEECYHVEGGEVYLVITDKGKRND